MAPTKLSFTMRNMTTFPIKRLCFDLQSEILEQLDAKDAIELVMVSRGFQGVIANRPSIVFGRYVHAIEFGQRSSAIEEIEIQKLPFSDAFSLDGIRHFPCTKNISSCFDMAVDCMFDDEDDDKVSLRFSQTFTAFLKQVEAVNSLQLFNCGPEDLELFLDLSIRDSVRLDINFPIEARSTKGILEHFIEAQLNNCEKVRFYCSNEDSFHFYYNASVKTHIKHVMFSCADRNLISTAILWIIEQGIPTKNPAAVFEVGREFMGYGEPAIKLSLLALITGYKGMKKISGENRQPVIEWANDRLEGRNDCALTMETTCFRRSINETSDCIYIFSLHQFFAFHIKPDEMIDN